MTEENDINSAFSPENSPIIAEIQNLSKESDQEEVVGAFIRLNLEVLLPIIDKVILKLQKAYQPYEESDSYLYGIETLKKEGDISSAISTLENQKTAYCELIEKIAMATDYQQFLSMMADLAALDHGEITPLYNGLSEAEIDSRDINILRQAILFRRNQARRLLSQNDLTPTTDYQRPLGRVLVEHKMGNAIKELDNLGSDEKQNAMILYKYYSDVLAPSVITMIEVDKIDSQGYNPLLEIYPYDKHIPGIVGLLQFLLSWKDKLNIYLDSLSEKTKQSPDYEPAKNALLENIDRLIPLIDQLAISLRTTSKLRESLL